jgi:hypothetical protein
MTDTPDPHDGFPRAPSEPDRPAGIGGRLVLVAAPFLVLAVVWWLFARFG